MTMDSIAKAMKAAENNRKLYYNRAFAAKTNAESTTHTAEAGKWGNEWLRLSREASKLAKSQV